MIAPSAGATYDDLVRAAARALPGSATPMLDARILVAHAAGFDAATLIAEARTPAPPAICERTLAGVARRAAAEPVAYIVGEKEFRGLTFRMRPGVLVPRPDSETLIDALEALRPDRDGALCVLDLGVGSGALLAATLAAYPNANGLGVDLSEGAARLAAENARALGLAGRMAIAVGDWAAPVGAPFDVILANPPYIPDADQPTLAPDVRDYEDPRALFAGPDGLDAYRRIVASLPDVLAADGLALVEVGYGQAGAATALARAHLPGAEVSMRADLAGVDRVICLDFAPRKDRPRA
ncbi:MAG: peptide chain release factor N(5)-glutamine methyltransferase [Pseudomonadota bacterium]